jgi:hypothetical protein
VLCDNFVHLRVPLADTPAPCRKKARK